MKCMHIDTVANFPFPTPPDRQYLRQAEKTLTYLGALEAPPNATTTPFGAVGGKVTDLGRTMSLFPLSPRFSKMLVSSRQHGCLPYAIAIVSAMSVGDPFLREEALGIDDPSGNEKEMSYVDKEAERTKEMSKLRRRAYFQSLQVSSQFVPIIETQAFGPNSITHHSANRPAICSGFSLWSVLMNTLAEASHSVRSIL